MIQFKSMLKNELAELLALREPYGRYDILVIIMLILKDW